MGVGEAVGAGAGVFVERGVWGAGYLPADPSEQVFADLSLNNWAAKWATGLYNDGYTAGCETNPLAYCPLDQHTRTEGSVFFLRIAKGIEYQPPDPVGIFSDVSIDAWYAGWVETAYNEGILPSCNTDPLQFCPNEPLDRAWTAYMLVQAKGGMSELTQ